jgi:L-seryl-tRNA(Ser) seleniumtransferase
MANHVPHLEIKWDPQRIKITPNEASAALRQGSPSIVLSSGERRDALSMNSFMLQPGEDAIIADKLYQLLKAHSA